MLNSVKSVVNAPKSRLHEFNINEKLTDIGKAYNKGNKSLNQAKIDAIAVFREYVAELNNAQVMTLFSKFCRNCEDGGMWSFIRIERSYLQYFKLYGNTHTYCDMVRILQDRAVQKYIESRRSHGLQSAFADKQNIEELLDYNPNRGNFICMGDSQRNELWDTVHQADIEFKDVDGNPKKTLN